MTDYAGNHPIIKLDALGRPMEDSSDDLAFRGEYTGTNLIYHAFARPGTLEGALAWQISFHTYDGSGNFLSTTWPQAPNGSASSEYQFSWTARASYTYS